MTLPTAPADTASGYVRLSRAAGTENLSRDGMVADIEREAERRGLRLVAMHVDDGISGAVRDRPEFTAWLDDARECRAAVLIAWHVDRATREGLPAAALIMDVVEGRDADGKTVRAPVRLLDTRGLDSAGSESWRLEFAIKAEIARAERERMRDRNRAKHVRATEAGRFPGGALPYGLRSVPNPEGAGQVLEPHPEQAPIIERMAAELLLGRAPGAIARRLNEEGIRPAKAEQWNRTSVRSALTHKAARLILGPAQFAAVAAILDERIGTGRAGRSRSRLLSGVLTCTGCDNLLGVGNSGNTKVYRCNERGNGRLCPAPVAISAESADALVRDRFLNDYGRLHVTERYTITLGSEEQAAAAEAVKAAERAIVAEPSADTVEALQAARRRLAEAAALPVQVIERVRELDRTLAEEWAMRDDAGRRDLVLRVWPGGIPVAKGARGARFDPERLLFPPDES